VVQRVSDASVSVDGSETGAIDAGLVAYVGVGGNDTERDALWIAEKIAELRVFEDAEGRMNRSLEQHGGAVLLISQFTLLGDARRGRRPSFAAAASGEPARVLYEKSVACSKRAACESPTGRSERTCKCGRATKGP
jgi:D-tyrosyl-tRNA(Tyr) deacylase